MAKTERTQERLPRRKERKEAARKKTAALRSRRLFIVGSTALGLITLAGIKSCLDRDPPLNLPKPDPSKYETKAEFISSGLPSPIRESEYPRPILNRDSLRYLLDTLITPPKDGGERMTGIKDNVVELYFQLSKGGNGRGTGLLIDESGIVLTAAHILTEKPGEMTKRGLVYSPYKKTQFLVSSAMIDEKLDLAIVYAPTGKPAQRATGIQFNTNEIPSGALLRQLGITRDNANAFLVPLDGQALEPNFKIPGTRDFKNLRAVLGMIPFGGSSGGPIIDLNTETIVAVESGFFTDKTPPFRRSDYFGSTIAPLTTLSELIETKPINTFI